MPTTIDQESVDALLNWIQRRAVACLEVEGVAAVTTIADGHELGVLIVVAQGARRVWIEPRDLEWDQAGRITGASLMVFALSVRGQRRSPRRVHVGGTGVVLVERSGRRRFEEVDPESSDLERTSLCASLKVALSD